MLERVILSPFPLPTMILILKIATNFFHMTLRRTMKRHHTKAGYKRLSGSKDVFWTNAGHANKKRLY